MTMTYRSLVAAILSLGVLLTGSVQALEMSLLQMAIEQRCQKLGTEMNQAMELFESKEMEAYRWHFVEGVRGVQRWQENKNELVFAQAQLEHAKVQMKKLAKEKSSLEKQISELLKGADFTVSNLSEANQDIYYKAAGRMSDIDQEVSRLHEHNASFYGGQAESLEREVREIEEGVRDDVSQLKSSQIKGLGQLLARGGDFSLALLTTEFQKSVHFGPKWIALYTNEILRTIMERVQHLSRAERAKVLAEFNQLEIRQSWFEGLKETLQPPNRVDAHSFSNGIFDIVNGVHGALNVVIGSLTGQVRPGFEMVDSDRIGDPQKQAEYFKTRLAGAIDRRLVEGLTGEPPKRWEPGLLTNDSAKPAVGRCRGQVKSL